MESDFSTQPPTSLSAKLRRFFFGKPLDPRQPETRCNTVLVAFLAWVGLGADGLSSACYGPETAFLALESHTHLALYLAIAMGLTVFIIALGYNQVIELFPSGGGGYKVATSLLGPLSGLSSGVALIVDYVLTIAVSIASAMDALFSLLPLAAEPYKSITGVTCLIILGGLNLRGTKESIKILMPIFLTFFISHLFLILYGLYEKANHLPTLVPNTLHATVQLSQQTGWTFIAALFLRAYSLGGGTYTGLEAVSNNINQLAPPRVTTGKWAMRYMATSLAFIAGGIILLYLLWDITPVPGQTLNAVTFTAVMSGWVWNGLDFTAPCLILIMLAEAGLLFVAANTGYIGGPMVLANMAADFWLPTRFRHLSSRLVTQNGIVLMGISAGCILFWTKGRMDLLVIMYSINVFLTFSLSLLGLSIYWIKNKNLEKNRGLRLVLSITGFIVTTSVLIIMIIEKFAAGGWITLFITSLLFFFSVLIKQYYTRFHQTMQKISDRFIDGDAPIPPPPALSLDNKDPSAIFFVGEHLGISLYTLKKVIELFPQQYKNFIFLNVCAIDAQNIALENELDTLQTASAHKLQYFVDYCRARNLPADYLQTCNVDVIDGLTELAQTASLQYSNCVFFAGTLIFERENWLNHWLHNHTATLVQRRLQFLGLYMMLLPLRLNAILDNHRGRTQRSAPTDVA